MNLTKKNNLYCSLRKEWVAALPEECVRQNLLNLMLGDLGYPLSLIAVEKGLKLLSPLMELPVGKFPKRRADIICFTKSSTESLQPLLIIECKATPLTHKAINQVKGYNHYIGAHFFAVANQTELYLGSCYSEHLIRFLPSYKKLLEFIK